MPPVKEGVKSMPIHVFIDASEMACGAVVYLRFECKNNTRVSTSFVTSKTRVAPLQCDSIP